MGDIVPVNNLAYPLKYDTTQGWFADEVGSKKSTPDKAKDDMLAKSEDITVVMGVNCDKYDPAKHNIIVISNASCTMNGLADRPRVVEEGGFRRREHKVADAFSPRP